MRKRYSNPVVSMKKNILILLIVVLVPIIALALAWVKLKMQNKMENKRPYYHITTSKGAIQDIYFIGDSWANRANRYNFSSKLDSILKSNRMVSKTISFGFDGYKSNEIYDKLFISGRMGYEDIIKRNPDYIILSCGINDQHLQCGPQYYAHHCSLIIDFLLHYHIQVILIELPNWDLPTNYSYYGRRQKIKNRLANFFTTGHLSYKENTYLYRKALYNELKQTGSLHKIMIVDAKTLDDARMWKESMHLNGKGYQRLAEGIASLIKESHTPTRHIMLVHNTLKSGGN